MLATYYDPQVERVVETELHVAEDLDLLATSVAQLRTMRGIPTIEVVRPDGSTLGFSFDDERAFLVWIDTLGDSYHSVGVGDGPALVFDYYGSWSEAPSEHLVSFPDALVAVRSFVSTGSPVTHSVLFSPD